MKSVFVLVLALLLAGCGGGGSSGSVGQSSVQPPRTPTIPIPPPASAVILPAYWGFFGDSHTDGRASIPSSHSPSLVFRAIWQASGYTGPVDVEVNGGSGRPLAGTQDAFEGHDFAGTPWIHAQESGDQNDIGQRTPEQFGDTFEAFWRAVDHRYPGSVKSYETAHSFQMKGAEYRDWQTTLNWARWGYSSPSQAISYNDEMLRRIQILANDGIIVHPVYTAEYIDALIARIPGGYSTIEQQTNPRHYNGIGNFMIALAMFKGLGYDVHALDFSTVTIDPDPVKDAQYKALCLEVVSQDLP